MSGEKVGDKEELEDVIDENVSKNDVSESEIDSLENTTAVIEGDIGTFAKEDAPWVGAEDRWLQGKPEVVYEQKQTKEDTEEPDRSSDFEIPESFAKMPSVMPEEKPKPPSKIPILAILLVAIVGLIGVWLIAKVGNERAEARDRRIMELENKIAMLTANNNPESAALVNELKAELEAIKDAPSAIEHKEEKSQGTKRFEPERKNRTLEQNQAPSDESVRVEDKEMSDTANTEANPDSDKSDDDLASTNADKIDGLPGNENVESKGIPGDFTDGIKELPSRDQVKTAMDTVAPTVKLCANKPGSQIVVRMIVQGKDGKVVSADMVTPEYQGTPIGACVVRVVKLAKFPRFSNDTLVIKYPFDL